MGDLKLYFKNKNLGNIDNHIKERIYNRNYKLIEIKLKTNEGISLNVYKYKNPFIFLKKLAGSRWLHGTFNSIFSHTFPKQV